MPCCALSSWACASYGQECSGTYSFAVEQVVRTNEQELGVVVGGAAAGAADAAGGGGGGGGASTLPSSHLSSLLDVGVKLSSLLLLLEDVRRSGGLESRHQLVRRGLPEVQWLESQLLVVQRKYAEGAWSRSRSFVTP